MRVCCVETGWMAEKVKDPAAVDNALDAGANRSQKPFELPAARAEGADIANRAHRDFHKASRVFEGLCFARCCGNALYHRMSRLFFRHASFVSRIFATDPRVAEVEQHFLQIVAVT